MNGWSESFIVDIIIYVFSQMILYHGPCYGDRQRLQVLQVDAGIFGTQYFINGDFFSQSCIGSLLIFSKLTQYELWYSNEVFK